MFIKYAGVPCESSVLYAGVSGECFSRIAVVTGEHSFLMNAGVYNCFVLCVMDNLTMYSYCILLAIVKWYFDGVFYDSIVQKVCIVMYILIIIWKGASIVVS